MIRDKYAIRFPGMQNFDRDSSESIFSEKAIIATKDVFLKTFVALGSLTGLVVQKSRTHELSKQLNIQKAALDEIVENQKEQKKIEFEEYTERLQVQLKFEKEKMELEMQEMVLEVSKKISKFSVSFEEEMRSNQILLRVVRNEQSFLSSIQPYIEFLSDDYSHRREYVLYCERQRKSLELVNLYLSKMI